MAYQPRTRKIKRVSALYYAIINKNQEMVDLLLESGAAKSDWTLAVSRKNDSDEAYYSTSMTWSKPKMSTISIEKLARENGIVLK